ncbi:MAG: MAPEG family protein [Gammaproteobacteria bacterium]
MNDTGSASRDQRTKTLVKVYPFGILLVSLLLNQFVLGVAPLLVALPSTELITFVAIAVVLLVVNHSWLMTTTELTRIRFNMHATPEEWEASDDRPENVSKEGWQALERHHNAHRNATENTVYFAVLVAVFVLVSPPVLAAAVWILGFAIGRVGHTFGFLTGNTSLRGLFMSVSLIAMYGMASYLVLALVS